MAIVKGAFSELFGLRKSILQEDYLLEYERPSLVIGMCVDLLPLLWDDNQSSQVRWLTKKLRKYMK